MQDPESYLRDLLGPLSVVTILDKEVDLFDVVRIDPAGDLRRQVEEHPLRAIAWDRIQAKCAARLAKLKDDLQSLKGQRFVAYYEVHEDQERKELDRCVFDEDMVLPEDRRKFLAQKISRGEKAPGRWRRNFTDALITHFVNSDPKVGELEKQVRLAQTELNLATSIVKVLDHRRWCLSNLVSLLRDVGR